MPDYLEDMPALNNNKKVLGSNINKKKNDIVKVKIPISYEDIYDLPPVIVTDYAPIILDTYYPFTSRYPMTGHSTLIVPLDSDKSGNYRNQSNTLDYNLANDIFINKSPKYQGIVNKNSHSKNYNLLYNNCSDATLNALNSMFGTNYKPSLFTTPGDVKDFVLNQLQGKEISKRNGKSRIIIPRNKNNAYSITNGFLKYIKNKDKHTAQILPKPENIY